MLSISISKEGKDFKGILSERNIVTKYIVAKGIITKGLKDIVTKEHCHKTKGYCHKKDIVTKEHCLQGLLSQRILVNNWTQTTSMAVHISPLLAVLVLTYCQLGHSAAQTGEKIKDPSLQQTNKQNNRILLQDNPLNKIKKNRIVL